MRGGGAMTVYDRSVCEAVEDHTDASVLLRARSRNSLGASPRRSPGPASKSGSAVSRRTIGGDTGRMRASKPKLTQEERRRRELAVKFEKTATLRDRDQKHITEHIERQHGMREERFKRLLDSVMGRDSLSYQTAMQLREREVHEERRRRQLYAEWDDHVYQPLQSQAFRHMNPPNRARNQSISGFKSVDFSLPDERPQLLVPVSCDPARRSVIDAAKENNFHHTASTVLRSASAPDLAGSSYASTRHVDDFAMPPARSRPTLEPMQWSQVALHGSMFTHFTNAAEHGSDFPRKLRGGSGVFIPSETDGVSATGKRTTRLNGHCDVGILRGEVSREGYSSQFKTAHGASSAAPLQDHFSFERGRSVVDLEIPLGKRVFPQYL